MKQMIWCLTIAFLFSCVSHYEVVRNQLQEQNSSYVGLHSDELLTSKGAPDLKSTLSTGEELWTYRTDRSGSSKGMTVSFGKNAGTDRRVIAWTETVNFVIDSTGVIKDYFILVE